MYHPGKAKLVVDALIRVTIGSVSYIEEAKKDLVSDVHILATLGVRLEVSMNGGFMVYQNFE